MGERITVGAQVLKAQRDNTKYDPFELGEALCNDILDEVWKCIEAHHAIIDEPEFCVVMVIATDNLIKGVKRRKFYAWPYLPLPRPNQMCFLYEKKHDSIRFLWSLPGPKVMAIVSEMPSVDKVWARTKRWSDSFYNGTFHEDIRKEHGIFLLSESEYLKANREELIKAGGKEVDSSFTKPFDFSKITVDKVINPNASFPGKYSLDDFRKAKTSNRDISPHIL